jgi:3-phosphoshikimate 1-carboxyvinyltransferase
VAAIGARVSGGDGGGVVSVTGGRDRLSAPPDVVDLGNSGTGMRLLAGVVAGLPGRTILTGDPSLCSRPMDRVAEPLGLMGATVEGHGARCLPPLTITGGALHAIAYTPPMASAQVKSAVLLAATGATGETVVHEPVRTRAHTEELLAAAGADIEVEAVGSGRMVRIRPTRLRPVTVDVPGDPSQAAFWVVAGVVVANSRLAVDGVHLGAERIGFVDVLTRMGADVAVVPGAEGTGSVSSASSRLTGTTVRAAEIPSLDEVPILAVAAAVAEGRTRFRDVGELRVKESDRLAATVTMLAAFGAVSHTDGDDLVVEGSTALRPGRYDAGLDHRMAMAAAVLAAAADGSETSTIAGWDAVATSYPGFADDLVRMGGDVREPSP